MLRWMNASDHYFSIFTFRCTLHHLFTHRHSPHPHTHSHSVEIALVFAKINKQSIQSNFQYSKRKHSRCERMRYFSLRLRLPQCDTGRGGMFPIHCAKFLQSKDFRVAMDPCRWQNKTKQIQTLHEHDSPACIGFPAARSLSAIVVASTSKKRIGILSTKCRAN